MAYNILSCSGWESEGASSFVGSAPCIKSRIGLVVLFFLIALIRKWGGEEIGLDFSFVLGLLGGIGAYLITITISGSFKWALILGIGGALLLGYGGGLIFGGSEE
jgi:hypothetical protein